MKYGKFAYDQFKKGGFQKHGLLKFSQKNQRSIIIRCKSFPNTERRAPEMNASFVFRTVRLLCPGNIKFRPPVHPASLVPAFRNLSGAAATHVLEVDSPNNSFEGPEEIVPLEVPMATISKSSFPEVFRDSLGPAIREADFVAIDLELSGVETARFRRSMEVDTPETRYLHCRNSAKNFAVVQLGVCTFKFNASKAVFEAKPYNMYVYGYGGMPTVSDIPCRTFLSHTSSMSFLANHGFDFNLWIRDGISYISVEEEAAIRLRLGLDEASDVGAAKFLSSLEDHEELALKHMADVAFREKMYAAINAWREGKCLDREQAIGQGGDPAGGEEVLGLWEGGVRAKAGQGDHTSRGSLAGDLPSHGQDEETLLGEEGMASDKEVTESMSVLDEGKDVPGEEGQEVTEDPEEGLREAGGAAEDSGSEFSKLSAKHFILTVLPLTKKQSKIIVQMVHKSFPDLMVLHEDMPGFKQVRIIFCGTAAGRIEVAKEIVCSRNRIQEQQLAEAVGVRRVIDEVINARKPLLLHNCLMDLCQLHEKFRGGLPETTTAFSQNMASSFPCVLDTKVVMKDVLELKAKYSAGPLASLFFKVRRLAAITNKDWRVTVAPGHDRYEASSDPNKFKHEAGFDAYMTGVLFTHACHLAKLAPSDLPLLCDAAVTASQARRATVGNFSSEMDNGGKVGLERLARLANIIPIGRQVWSEMVFDLATGKELPRQLPMWGKRARAILPPDRGNVVFVWGLDLPNDRSMSREMLRQFVTKGWIDKNNKPHYHILDSGAALLEFRNERLALRFLNASIPGNTSTSSAATPAAIQGASAVPYSVYYDLCKLNLSVETASAAASAAGLQEWVASRRRARLQSPGAAGYSQDQTRSPSPVRRVRPRRAPTTGGVPGEAPDVQPVLDRTVLAGHKGLPPQDDAELLFGPGLSEEVQKLLEEL